MSTTKPPMTKAQRNAIAALLDAYDVVLRSLYDISDGVDIATFVESGNAPDELRAEWEAFSSPEYDFARELMPGATR